MSTHPAITEALLGWFGSVRRDLPWRRTKDPYRIWVSEIMLQQTRAQAVIPYYERFLARFPTVEALAAAREEDVLALCAGLGAANVARPATSTLGGIALAAAALAAALAGWQRTAAVAVALVAAGWFWSSMRLDALDRSVLATRTGHVDRTEHQQRLQRPMRDDQPNEPSERAEQKAFGQQLVTDHNDANSKATAVAKDLGVDPPQEPSKKQKADYEKLSKLSGDAFDKQFAKHMVADHKKDIAEYKADSKKKDPTASYASDSLPVLQKHLDMAQTLAKTLGAK